MKSERFSNERNTSSTVPSQTGLAMLFSGGLDTTVEVAERLKTYTTIHLLTFNNGYCINMSGARRRVAELRRRFGEARLFHAEVSTHALLTTLIHGYAPLRSEFRSPLYFDLLCKMAAVAELIVFAKAQGVTDLSDGAAAQQTQIFIQHPEFASCSEALIASHGLRSMPPEAFDMSREEKWGRLRELGLASGLKALEKVHITSQILHQPFCLRGFVTYFFTSPLRHIDLVKRRSLPMARAKALWDRMIPVADQYIRDKLAEAEPRPS